MSGWTIYALKSISRKFIYVGFTENMTRRFNEHQKGKVQSTKPYRPFEILFTELCKTRIEARQREKYLKSGVGKEFLKSL